MYEINQEVQEKFNLAKAAIEEVQQIRAMIGERENELKTQKESLSEVERLIGEAEAASFPSKIVRAFSDGPANGKNLEKQLISLSDQVRITEAKLAGLKRLEKTAVENLPKAKKEFEAARGQWGQETMAAYRAQVREKALELVDAYEFGCMLASVCDDRYFSAMVIEVKLPDPTDGLRDLTAGITALEGRSFSGAGGYRAAKWDESKPALRETYERLQPVTQLSRQIEKMVRDIKEVKVEKSASKVA